MDSVRLSKPHALGVAEALWALMDELRSIMPEECDTASAIHLAASLDDKCAVPRWPNSAESFAGWRQLAQELERVEHPAKSGMVATVTMSPTDFEDLMDIMWTVALNTESWHHRAHALTWIRELDSQHPIGTDTSVTPERMEWLHRILASALRDGPADPDAQVQESSLK